MTRRHRLTKHRRSEVIVISLSSVRSFNHFRFVRPIRRRALRNCDCADLSAGQDERSGAFPLRSTSISRCFKHSAALNWNDLPLYDIRACDSVNVFKRKLKTHLFNIAYPT